MYSVYKVCGLNLGDLVNNLKRKGVSVIDAKKTDDKTLYLAVNYQDREKFFAITDKMCYNITYIRDKGALKFLFALKTCAGLIIGAVAFLIISVLSDDLVFAVEYRGTGSVYKRKTDEFLKSRNVGVFSRFSDIDIPALADGILAYNDGLSFAECYKYGNRLIIYSAVSKTPVKTLNTGSYSLVSDTDGVIESIKVYRGTALKSAGDRVNKGEEICAGYAVIKDKTVNVGVVATVSLKAEFVYGYLSGKDGEENIAEIFAVAAAGEKNVLNVSTEKTATENGEYFYRVTVTYRKLLYG